MDSRPFAPTADVYDLLYEAAGKDYRAEAAALHELIQSRHPEARSLLDVACGTGAHLVHLREHYDVAGTDLEPAMLDQARQRLPHVALTEADMRYLDLGDTFDVVTCLFSAIGYMPSTTDLDRAIGACQRHLAPGGLLIVDGWIRRSAWIDPGVVHALSMNRDQHAVARVVRSRRSGTRTTLELHHLVGSPRGVEHIVETHELTLFRDEEYRAAFERAGLTVDVVASPHPERDRYVGRRPR